MARSLSWLFHRSCRGYPWGLKKLFLNENFASSQQSFAHYRISLHNGATHRTERTVTPTGWFHASSHLLSCQWALIAKHSDVVDATLIAEHSDVADASVLTSTTCVL